MADLAVGQVIRLADGRNAILRFVGETEFAPGVWVGCELDDGSGKNDGSVQGERYFECDMGHGMFVRPSAVTVLSQPPPRQRAAPTAAATTAAATSSAAAKKRPSSFASGGLRSTSTSLDPNAGRRKSMNAPSPSPVGRTSRPTSIARSPTKSPTKQLGLGTATSSASTSRTATPANARGGAAATRAARVSSTSTTTRNSMGPPARPGRQASVSSTAGGRAAARTSANRLSLSTTATGKARAAEASKRGSPGSQSGTEKRASVDRGASNRKIEDLEAKLRVMERKRMEDRDKIKLLDKVQADRDKFEGIIQKLQQKYGPMQQELADSRRQLADLKKSFESVERMQAEHDSELELATLDREMAEETAEVLKSEVEALKEKAEELELELEILREENSEYTKGMSPEEKASTNWIQLERNNERLREALIRLRDLTQQQEEELRGQIKSLEEDVQELSLLKEQNETSQDKLTHTEAMVEDLRQQLDTALGAEDMIEDLTERNMSQAEQIEELKAIVDDLENLKEVNDELEINHVQNEKEMQEEIDFKDSVIAEQARRAAQQEEALEDMEYTLSRFRELVNNLQGDLQDMKASQAVTEGESEKLNSRSRAMEDLTMKLQISAEKAQAKTIDLEMRRLEAQEAEQHLEIIKLFLPDSYQSDQNSVLALLRFRRLAFKANLLHQFLQERVKGQAHPGHEDDVFSGCDAMDKLTWVSSMCDRFVNSISHCSLEQFSRYEGALFELEPVERALNGWIEGLKRDELKEKQCAGELQRTIALMSHLGEVHISDDLESFADDVYMKTVLMQSHLESAATAFATLQNMVQHVIPAVSEEDELAQFFTKRADAVVTQTRSTKVIAGRTVAALEDLRVRSLALSPETKEVFAQCEAISQELSDLAQKIGHDLHQLLHDESRAEPFTYLEVQSRVRKTVLDVAASDESDLFTTYLNKLRTLTRQITDLSQLAADFTQTQEFERSTAPWILRSQELRSVKTVPVDAEEEVRRLKEEWSEARRAVAQREESLSTALLKIETLESRMRDATAKANLIADLELQIEQSKEGVAALQEDIEKQDRELKTLEADRDKWKKIAGDSRAINEAAAGTKAGKEMAVATAREMETLKEEIAALQSAVRYLRQDNRRARLTEQGGYDWLAEPLNKPTPVAEQRRQLVVAEGRDVLGELLKMATLAKVYDLGSLPRDKLAWKSAKSTPQYHAARQMEELAAWQGWRDSVVRKGQTLTVQQQQHRGPDAVNVRRARNAAAARLHIRLPDLSGKMIPGSNTGNVQIVGSREWEGLQGRLAV
ncbi:hypothetical protein M406DRAFT_97457 [Cryphonectria parasitica EP155]|uniref:CAP-Gly domain-containing protein n=1 Tax=Cryphonectria parasitica (strain ATCC 38755 / EP155) TaxID=660469 RepID=A0A9P4Y3X8_CRYP1|nr:uncharacterized protein M406DRAFT_97457 [Cryphonectria parasitica EP155]KAF3766076.1 hypothetical protein M406DRAFT_97457 [Cryphonectria parasitica EP155]